MMLWQPAVALLLQQEDTTANTTMEASTASSAPKPPPVACRRCQLALHRVDRVYDLCLLDDPSV